MAFVGNLASSTITIYEDEVQGQFLNRNIDIMEIELYHYLEYPLFIRWNNLFPVDTRMERAARFRREMDWEAAL